MRFFTFGVLMLLLLPGLLLAGLWLSGPCGRAEAQVSAQVPMGRRLTGDMVRQEVERRLAAGPKNEAVIWNAGYDFLRHFPKNQDTAKAIREGFLTARTNDPGQKRLLNKAADYWGHIHDYGIANVPAGQNWAGRDNIYHNRSRARADRSRLRRPGSKHQGFPNYDRPGRALDKSPSPISRDPNPYPGKYYQGMYPP